MRSGFFLKKKMEKKEKKRKRKGKKEGCEGYVWPKTLNQ